MRIVGGSLGGRVLRAPHGAATRPTSEKVREAIFNILGPVEGAYVLDLFAGSGALGIEALSRGAAHVTFVDAGKPALTAIRGNLRELGLEGRSTVLAMDAIAAAQRPPPAPPPQPAQPAQPAQHPQPQPVLWSVVFIDPPYASDLAQRAALALPATSLQPGAQIVIEHDRRGIPPETLGSLIRTDQRRYGDTMISFFEVAA